MNRRSIGHRASAPQSIEGTAALLRGEPRRSKAFKYDLYFEASDGSAGLAAASTSTFEGNERQVDLEDAFEFGGWDSVAVVKRKGRFNAREAGKVLRQVVRDLTYEHNPWIVMSAGPNWLGVRQSCDLDSVQGARSFETLLEILRISGASPRRLKEDAKAGVFRASVCIDGRRAISAFPDAGRSLGSILDAVAGKPRFDVLVVPQMPAEDSTKAAALGVQVVRLKKLLALLHEARILTIEQELAERLLLDRNPSR